MTILSGDRYGKYMEMPISYAPCVLCLPLFGWLYSGTCWFVKSSTMGHGMGHMEVCIPWSETGDPLKSPLYCPDLPSGWAFSGRGALETLPGQWGEILMVQIVFFDKGTFSGKGHMFIRRTRNSEIWTLEESKKLFGSLSIAFHDAVTSIPLNYPIFVEHPQLFQYYPICVA